MPVPAAIVIQHYQGILRITPSAAQIAAGEAAADVNALDQQLLGAANVSVDPIIRLYQSVFGRVPDAAGLNFWVGQLNSGVPLTSIAAAFASSGEFQSRYAGLTNAEIVAAFYVNILGRTGDPAGVAFWTNALNTGLPLSELVLAFSQSPEFIERSEPYVNGFLLHAADLTQDYSGSLFQPDNLPPGTEVTLTVGQDIVTANIFDAPLALQPFTGVFLQTLNSSDELTGAGANSTLNAVLNNTDTGFGLGTRPTITNVADLNFTVVAGAASSIDASDITGAKIIRSVNSLSSLTVNSVQTLDIDVGLKSTYNGADLSVFFANTAVAGTTDAVDVELDNVGRGAAGASLTDIFLAGESAGGVETVNINSIGAANHLASISSNVGGTDFLTTINIVGDADLTIDNTLVGVTKVDATAFTGDLDIRVDGAADVGVSVRGGAGDDTVTWDATGTGASSFTSKDFFDGGAGYDDLVLRNTAAGALLATDVGANIVNVEEITHQGDVAFVDLTVDWSRAGSAHTLELAGTNYDDVFITNLNNEDVVKINSDIDFLGLSFKTNTANNVFNLELAGGVDVNFVGTAAITPFVGLEEFNVKSTGATPNAIHAAIWADSNVVITGDQDFTFGDTLAYDQANGTVDGSAATGRLTIYAGANSQTLIGGSAADLLRGGADADLMQGNTGADTFSIPTTAESRDVANFSVTDTTTEDIDKLPDFQVAQDELLIDSAGIVSVVDFNPTATAVVQSVTIGDVTDFSGLYTELAAAFGGAGAASTANTARVYDITVSGDGLGGSTRFVLVNNSFGVFTADDTIIDVTGVDGTLTFNNFAFV